MSKSKSICELCEEDNIRSEANHYYHNMNLCVYHWWSERDKPDLDRNSIIAGNILFYKDIHPRYTKRLRKNYPDFDKLLKKIE